jgi:uncharacterized protein YdbL (DUF1318 family)
MTYFFARTNLYGSETDTGFANTFKAIAFLSKAERDAYVLENETRNLGVTKITKREATKLADRHGPDLYVETVDGRYVRI